MKRDTLLYYTKPRRGLGETKGAAAAKRNAGYIAAHGGEREVLSEEEYNSLPVVYQERESAKNSEDSKFVEQPVYVTVTYQDDNGNTNEEKVDSNWQEQQYRREQIEIENATSDYIRENAEVDESGNVVEKNYVQEYLDTSGRQQQVTENLEPEFTWPGAVIEETEEGDTTTNRRRKTTTTKNKNAAWYGVAAAALLLAVVATDDDKKKNENKEQK